MDNMEIILTNAEWKIMNLLWEESPLTLREIQDKLKGKTDWSKHAIISFLKRLISKRAIRVDENIKPKQYYPLIKKEDAMKNETLSLVDKVYEGKIGLLVSHLVEQEMTEDEINELKKILLDKKEK